MRYLGLVTCIFLLIALAFPINANSQGFPTEEFTPVCNECVYGINWDHPDPNVRFHELFLPDPKHPDRLRRIFKGPSKNARVTVSGSQTAKLRACFFEGNCSTFIDLHMIPEKKLPDQGLMNHIRILSPIELLHESSITVVAPNISGRVYEPESVLLDFTATGQRGCERGVGQRTWNIGTRLKISISSENAFEVRNTSVVEHGDGWWTWTGAMTGNHIGTMTMTADDCAEKAYVSIESDYGVYSIQPMAEPAHIIYRVDPSEDDSDCTQSRYDLGLPLIKFEDGVDGDGSEPIGEFVNRSRVVRFDFEEFDQRVAPFLILLGPDRSHDAANFVNTTATLELFPGDVTKFDFRHGEFTSRDSTAWQWRGCLAGEPDSQLHLVVDRSNQKLNLSLRRGVLITAVQATSGGRHRIVEMQQ